jgi:hypothetical protein
MLAPAPFSRKLEKRPENRGFVLWRPGNHHIDGCSAVGERDKD